MQIIKAAHQVAALGKRSTFVAKVLVGKLIAVERVDRRTLDQLKEVTVLDFD
ncbi:hypothetical protein D3C87_1799610 [compost metagenome]